MFRTPPHPLNVETDAGSNDPDMTGVDQQPLPGCQIFGDHLARQVEPDRSRTGHPLEDKSLAAEKRGAQALLKRQFESHSGLRHEKCLLATDQRFAGRQLKREDMPRKPRRKGDLAQSRPGGGVGGDEEAAAG